MPYLRALPLTASSGGAAPVEEEDVLGVGYLIDEGLAEALHTHRAEAAGVVDLNPRWLSSGLVDGEEHVRTRSRIKGLGEVFWSG